MPTDQKGELSFRAKFKLFITSNLI